MNEAKVREILNKLCHKIEKMQYSIYPPENEMYLRDIDQAIASLKELESDILKLVLCDKCSNEIKNGNTVLWSKCLLCSCRHYREREKKLEPKVEEIEELLLPYFCRHIGIFEDCEECKKVSVISNNIVNYLERRLYEPH